MQCDTGKITYATRQAANDAAAGFRRQKRGQFRSYLCPVCNCFHLTSTDKNKALKNKPKKHIHHETPVIDIRIKIKKKHG
jgi:hypothetical protein